MFFSPPMLRRWRHPVCCWVYIFVTKTGNVLALTSVYMLETNDGMLEAGAAADSVNTKEKMRTPLFPPSLLSQKVLKYNLVYILHSIKVLLTHSVADVKKETAIQNRTWLVKEYNVIMTTWLFIKFKHHDLFLQQKLNKTKIRQQNVFDGNQVVLLASGIRTQEMFTKADLRLIVATQILM